MFIKWNKKRKQGKKTKNRKNPTKRKKKKKKNKKRRRRTKRYYRSYWITFGFISMVKVSRDSSLPDKRDRLSFKNTTSHSRETDRDLGRPAGEDPVPPRGRMVDGNRPKYLSPVVGVTSTSLSELQRLGSRKGLRWVRSRTSKVFEIPSSIEGVAESLSTYTVGTGVEQF